MKVETPQILWNAEEENGKNAALMSISMVRSGIVDNNLSQYGNVLATAGNTNIINLFKVSCKNTTADSSTPIFQRGGGNTKVDYMCSLTRHEGAVNAVAFSPDGLHLATAGDTGSVIIWSVPVSKRGNGNGQHYWSTVQREQDLSVRIVSRIGEGICDISWSADSKRFLAGTIDHSVFVCEDGNYEANRSSPNQVESDWKIVYRNAQDHTHYVQGVSYDPLGVYLASMSSDRTVRVYPRKTPPKSKKKVLRPANAGATSLPPLEHQRMVDALLTDNKLEISKTKQLKYRRTVVDETGATVKQHLYADESTLASFVRRLSWTTDGAFLVTPAALWHADPTDKQASPSYATYMFARHKFDEPYKVLSGLEKPSLAVRPNPVLFKLPPGAEESKENQSPKGEPRGLPYRSIFCVLTWDSVLIYDTHHTKPLSVIRGLHYANLVDAAWTTDGMNLLVCSTDGYISIISFADGELGQVYTPPTANLAPKEDENTAVSETIAEPAPPTVATTTEPSKPLPPCEPGQAAVEAPPAKRAKKVRITPILVAAVQPSPPAKRPADSDATKVGEAVDKLSLDNTDENPKKKKRIQPVLLTST